MIITDKGHFWLTFKNGYTISVFNGYGSYSENHFARELIDIPKFCEIGSKDCEIAIIYKDNFVTGRFVECGDSVKGYIRADELADIIYKVKNYNGELGRKNYDKERNISKN